MKLEITKTDNLNGTIDISGSKNATLPLMVCSLLTSNLLILNNVPDITDVSMMMNLLKQAGLNVTYMKEEHKLYLKKNKINTVLNEEDVHKIRASYYIMGAFVANNKNFITNFPGGCAFSKRPIDYHLDAFKKVGYKIEEKSDNLIFEKLKSVKGELIFSLPKESVGTTINIIYISVLRDGLTIVENPSLEPEVLQVIDLLNIMGSKIIIDNNILKISGVKKLNGAYFDIMSDRIEAGSYMLLASAISKSNITINNIYLPHLKEVIKTIKELGVKVIENNNSIIVRKDNSLNGIKKEIKAYPSFPTDLQQILTVVCSVSKEKSKIIDTIYPERKSHLKEINKAGGIVNIMDNYIEIYPSNLRGTNLYAHDLRCGFACIVIGCIASNKSYIENAELILRGYENLVKKLNNLGVKVRQID